MVELNPVLQGGPFAGHNLLEPAPSPSLALVVNGAVYLPHTSVELVSGNYYATVMRFEYAGRGGAPAKRSEG